MLRIVRFALASHARWRTSLRSRAAAASPSFGCACFPIVAGGAVSQVRVAESVLLGVVQSCAIAGSRGMSKSSVANAKAARMEFSGAPPICGPRHSISNFNQTPNRLPLSRDTLVDAAVFREWMLGIGRRSAYARIAHLLCEVFVRFHAVGLTNNDECELPITQSEISRVVAGLVRGPDRSHLSALRPFMIVPNCSREIKLVFSVAQAQGDERGFSHPDGFAN